MTIAGKTTMNESMYLLVKNDDFCSDRHVSFRGSHFFPSEHVRFVMSSLPFEIWLVLLVGDLQRLYKKVTA